MGISLSSLCGGVSWSVMGGSVVGGMVDMVKHLKIRNGVASPCHTCLYCLRRRALLRFFIYSTICTWLFCLAAVVVVACFCCPLLYTSRSRKESSWNQPVIFSSACAGRYREGRREQKCLFAPVFRVRPTGECCGALRCGGFSVCAHGRNRVVIPLGAVQGLGGCSAGGLFWTPAVSAAGGVCSAPAVGGSIPVSASALASSGV